MDFLSQFMPTSLHEWIYIGIIVILLFTVFFYNKAMMKSKDIIESYVDEIRELKGEEVNG